MVHFLKILLPWSPRSTMKTTTKKPLVSSAYNQGNFSLELICYYWTRHQGVSSKCHFIKHILLVQKDDDDNDDDDDKEYILKLWIVFDAL